MPGKAARVTAAFPLRPRWANRVWAAIWAFYWLPWPRCGRMFGGHEGRLSPDWHREPFVKHAWMTCRYCQADGVYTVTEKRAA